MIQINNHVLKTMCISNILNIAFCIRRVAWADIYQALLSVFSSSRRVKTVVGNVPSIQTTDSTAWQNTLYYCTFDSSWLLRYLRRGVACHLPSYTYISEGKIVLYNVKGQCREKENFFSDERREKVNLFLGNILQQTQISMAA